MEIFIAYFQKIITVIVFFLTLTAIKISLFVFACRDKQKGGDEKI